MYDPLQPAVSLIGLRILKVLKSPGLFDKLHKVRSAAADLQSILAVTFVICSARRWQIRGDHSVSL